MRTICRIKNDEKCIIKTIMNFMLSMEDAYRDGDRNYYKKEFEKKLNDIIDQRINKRVTEVLNTKNKQYL